MIVEWSDEENARIMVEQLGMSEQRARFVVALERGEIEGDAEVIDGPLTTEDKRRLGIGSIFAAPTQGGGGVIDTE